MNWNLDTDDEKNNDTMNIDDNFMFIINEDNYEKLFKKLKYLQSKKLVHYLMDKVVLFGAHYQDPKRLKIMRQLKMMRNPYKKVFDEDMI